MGKIFKERSETFTIAVVVLILVIVLGGATCLCIANSPEGAHTERDIAYIPFQP